MPSVDVVIPVYNEERDLPRCLETLVPFLRENMPGCQCRVVVADNGSTDRTLEVAKSLAQKCPGEVAYLHLPEKGRGRALKQAWMESSADVVSFMDVDLSTRLDAFPALVHAITQGGYDIAIGSRLMKGAKVIRGLRREVISRCYNLLIKLLFFTRFSDAQCGFKALSRRVVQELVPLVKDNGWFLDTELLLLAEKNGYKIKDIPVTWVDDPDSRVNIAKTARGDLAGLLRLRFGGVPRPLKQERQG
jgi:glycosyltransferase involved in cell wall biosynthesis